MRIALVCDWYYPRIGGIERHLAGLSGRLVAGGNDVTVITPMRGAATPRPDVKLQLLPGRFLPAAKMLGTPGGFRELGRMLMMGQFDVVHAHASIVSPTAFVAAAQAQAAQLPVVVTLHSILGRYRHWFHQIDRLFHWSCWPVVFSGVSRRVAAELEALVAARPVIVLPNAIDPQEWNLPHDPPSDSIDIACVMRLVPRKRGEALLHAFCRSRAQAPVARRIRLHLAGAGPERGRLERLARRLGISDHVQFHGALAPAEVKQLLARSHYFVLPSRLEAFGIAALEARAAGLPVVAMRDSGVAEFIADGREGLLASNDDELAACLLRLCTDSALAAAITTHNHATPVAFTWDRAVRQHLEAYDVARELCAGSVSTGMARRGFRARQTVSP